MVRAILQACADGCGLRRIARAFNGDPGAGAITAHYFGGHRVSAPRKGSGSWDPSEVRAILRRELYRGMPVWEKYRNVDKGGRRRRPQPESAWLRVAQPELRLVSDELWDAVERRHRSRTITGGPAAGYAFGESLFRARVLQGLRRSVHDLREPQA